MLRLPGADAVKTRQIGTSLVENDLITAAADEIRQEDPNRVVELVLELDEILKTVLA